MPIILQSNQAIKIETLKIKHKGLLKDFRKINGPSIVFKLL